MTRRRKIGRIILGVVVLSVVAHSIASVILGRRLNTEIAAIEARGEPISPLAFVLPDIPDEENAAVLYAGIHELVHPREGESCADLGVLRRPGSQQHDPQAWADTRDYLAARQHVIPLIEEAVSRPKCRFDIGAENWHEEMFSQLASLRRLCQFLLINATVQLHDGRPEQALHSIDLAFRIPESLSDYSTLNIPLVRVAIIKAASSSLRDVLDREEITDSHAEALCRTLAGIDLRPSLADSVLGDRARGIQSYQNVISSPIFACSNYGRSGFVEGSGSAWKVTRYAWLPFRQADELRYIGLMEGLIDLSRKPYRETHLKYPQTGDSSQNEAPVMVSGLMASGSAYRRATTAVDDATAEVSGSRIALALKVFKNRYGAYPENLGQLREKLRWEIPEDPFSGRDFVYRPDGDGFVLYSIGRNLKDHGAIPASEGRSGGPDYQYRNKHGKNVADIVWEIEQ